MIPCSARTRTPLYLQSEIKQLIKKWKHTTSHYMSLIQDWPKWAALRNIYCPFVMQWPISGVSKIWQAGRLDLAHEALSSNAWCCLWMGHFQTECGGTATPPFLTWQEQHIGNFKSPKKVRFVQFPPPFHSMLRSMSLPHLHPCPHPCLVLP